MARFSRILEWSNDMPLTRHSTVQFNIVFNMEFDPESESYTICVFLQYKTHYIKGKDGSRLPFVFNDIMGLEPDDGQGAHVKDIITALKGFLEEGYKFNPANPVSEKDSNYKTNPKVSDQTFCLVNILAANTVSLMDQKLIQKMKEIREEASEYNLPQVIIMTKVDEACPLVKEDLRKVYTSKKIKEKMQECSNLLGIPLSNIFPVKNYHEEVDTNDDMDVLILQALDQIVNLASDALENQNPKFDKPWRIMPWGNKDSLGEKLSNFKLCSSDVKFVRLLIVGEVGAGKSSFINSVNNVFQERITCGALVDATSGTSFTKNYKTHHIKGKDDSRLPFVFNDIMGLEPDDGRGAHVQDIISALKGFLEEGYKFNPANHVSEKDSNYRTNPKVSDQTFCLVNVIAASTVSFMNQKLIQKMKRIREEATEYNLPQVIIMTKVDEACPLVKEDLRKVYTSKKIKEKMQECSNLLGIPLSNIFPVKNYHEEVDTNDDMDVLILKALDQIVNLANDALENQNPSEKSE
ncbi:interferon-induced protein 44-like isoform X2 [Ictalurus furcatus]|uniref:interferon-induced protein 44-like isoform X2 n=1 Tax=Ictalurus furcatus TaxID=66913 RepID=UPI0023501F53|nr:interferon-induced protein 44-like isoform X2 [Ictalurus furcatus]